MRIACIAASQIPSRTANSIEVMKVCQAFVELGHDVHLWVPGPDPGVGWDSLKEHYGLRFEFPISWLSSIPALRRYDFSLRAVMHAQSWKADLLYIWPLQAAMFAATRKLPTMIELHDVPQGRLAPWLFRRMLAGSGLKLLLPITQALDDWLSDAYARAYDSVPRLVLPSGVDLEQYAGLPEPGEARLALGLEDRFTAGYTGHLYEGRGMDLLLELAERNPEVQFLWAGGEQAAVQHWAAKIRAKDIENIVLLGFIENKRLPLIQAACEALLMPYERRVSGSSGGDTARFASPMKLFEYLAAGRVILSSDLPVFREVLKGSNAVLLPPDDVSQWNKALQKAFREEGLRVQLSVNAREDAGQHDWRVRQNRALDALGTCDDA